MFELGKRGEIFGEELLREIPAQYKHLVTGRPKGMPPLNEEKREKVICGYDQGLGERLIVCDTLEEMQQLYDAYAAGSALQIKWYTGEDPGTIVTAL